MLGINLILSGCNDKFLVNNPEITFFKIVYKQNIGFLKDTIKLNFEEHFKFNSKLTCNIPKHGNYLSKVYLSIKFSQINNYLHDDYVRFCFVKKLGYAIIKKIEFQVGHNIIESISCDWLNIWNELNNKSNIDEMIGNKPEIYNFSKSKKGFELLVPINFNFCNNYKLAFPLHAVKKQDIKINLYTSKLEDICLIGPTHSVKIKDHILLLKPYEIIKQNYNGVEVIALFLNYNPTKKILNYIKIKNDFISQTSINDTHLKSYIITGETSKFKFYLEDNSTITTSNNDYINYFKDNIIIEKSNILIDTIHTCNNENNNNEINNIYTNTSYQYLNKKINNRLLLKLNFNFSSKELIWVVRLKSHKKIDFFKYTDYNDENIINKIRFTIDNLNIINYHHSNFYNYHILHKNYNNLPSTGIYIYPFCLNSSDIQPSGNNNLNNNIILDILFNKFINEDIEILVINLSYNLLNFKNGICSFKFINN